MPMFLVSCRGEDASNYTIAVTAEDQHQAMQAALAKGHQVSGVRLEGGRVQTIAEEPSIEQSELTRLRAAVEKIERRQRFSWGRVCALLAVVLLLISCLVL